MAKRVKVGKFYKVTHRDLFDVLGGILNVGDIVQIVNPIGGRTRGMLRHVINKKGEITFCNIENLEPV